jgi:hypothetical protein
VLLLSIPLGLSAEGQAEAPPARTAEGGFALSHAFYGRMGYTDPAALKNFDAGMLNAFSFWHPLDAGMEQFLTRHPASMIFTMSAAARVEGLPVVYVESQRQELARLRASTGLNIAWNLMDEWDQGGGHWVPQGRPRYTGLTRQQAHEAFTSYYLDRSPPLGTYLREGREQRACPLVAQTDYPMNAFYAFQMGVDVCLLERGIDELGDLSTGIAFVRGAARQFGRTWGIDLSLWRTSNDSATQFDRRGVLTGGWSPSYVRRHLHIAYLSGAQWLQIEPANYYGDDGQLNPLGRVARDFADFALRRHPDVGQPVVSTAVMSQFHSGFDPKHWIHGQDDAVWYGDIPYSEGDHMLNNFLKVAYPGHWLHGLAPGAPFADASGAPIPDSFKRYLRAGGDPRPFEPMGSTRWGDNLDIIADNASPAALRSYNVIALIGGVVLDDRLRDALRSWVLEGGILVMNVKQVTAADEPLLGVRLSATEGAGDGSTWLEDGTRYEEPRFMFTRVTPVTATLLATSGEAEPLVTSHSLGRGRVILTTAHYLQATDKSQLLNIGVRLFDWIDGLYARARINGAPIEYIVNSAPDKTIVTLINNSGTTWDGTVTFTTPPKAFAVKEYISDAKVASERSGGNVVIDARVPRYGLKVYALEAR